MLNKSSAEWRLLFCFSKRVGRKLVLQADFEVARTTEHSLSSIKKNGAAGLHKLDNAYRLWMALPLAPPTPPLGIGAGTWRLEIRTESASDSWHVHQRSARGCRPVAELRTMASSESSRTGVHLVRPAT